MVHFLSDFLLVFFLLGPLATLVSTSVSVRVQKEDVCSHPDLESWTYTHC